MLCSKVFLYLWDTLSQVEMVFRRRAMRAWRRGLGLVRTDRESCGNPFSLLFFLGRSHQENRRWERGCSGDMGCVSGARRPRGVRGASGTLACCLPPLPRVARPRLTKASSPRPSPAPSDQSTQATSTTQAIGSEDRTAGARLDQIKPSPAW